MKALFAGLLLLPSLAWCQATPVGQRGRLTPGRDAELPEDVRDVDACGLAGDEELASDLAVRTTVGDQDQHLALTAGKPVDVPQRALLLRSLAGAFGKTVECPGDRA